VTKVFFFHDSKSWEKALLLLSGRHHRRRAKATTLPARLSERQTAVQLISREKATSLKADIGSWNLLLVKRARASMHRCAGPIFILSSLLLFVCLVGAPLEDPIIAGSALLRHFAAAGDDFCLVRSGNAIQAGMHAPERCWLPGALAPNHPGASHCRRTCKGKEPAATPAPGRLAR
jgi:hypothetical protein